MQMNLGLRRRIFLQSLPFVLVPALLVIPSLKFFSMCPPEYGQVLAWVLLLLFGASELWGLIGMFRCFTGTLDPIFVGCVLSSVVGLLTLGFSVWVLSIRPPK